MESLRIPKFNNGGCDNVMNLQEINSWDRQMKSYIMAGEVKVNIKLLHVDHK
jgi:hypothetical protein